MLWRLYSPVGEDQMSENVDAWDKFVVSAVPLCETVENIDVFGEIRRDEGESGQGRTLILFYVPVP
jgi:hypothetical protein